MVKGLTSWSQNSKDAWNKLEAENATLSKKLNELLDLISAMQSEISDLKSKDIENDKVIAVWRGRTNRAEEKLLMASAADLMKDRDEARKASK